MIRPSDSGVEVYVCLDPVDFRKQAAGLAALVQVMLELDPFAPAIFAFTNRRRNAARLLMWERNGFVLVRPEVASSSVERRTESSIQPCVPPQVVYLQVRSSNGGFQAAGTRVPLALPASLP